MNFKQFLSSDQQIQESCSDWSTNRVIVGFGSFYPFHIGYMPMISEMISQSEQLGIEPLLVVVNDNTNLLPTILETLKNDFPNMQIQIAASVQDALLKLNRFEQCPATIMGSARLVQEAKNTCSVLYRNQEIQYTPSYLDGIQKICLNAVLENDYVTFKSNILEVSDRSTEQIFAQLKEVLNG